MNSDFEYVIVGAGGMGSAAAYHLARDGRSVLLLEQFEIGHPRGSSYGESRIIRLSYDHPTYVRLAQDAYRFVGRTGSGLWTQTGAAHWRSGFKRTFQSRSLKRASPA